MVWVGFGLVVVLALGFLGKEIVGGFVEVGGRSVAVVGGIGECGAAEVAQAVAVVEMEDR